MSQVVSEFGDLFVAMFGIVNDILLPSGGLTPLAIVAWAGFLAPMLWFVFGFIRGMASAGRRRA